MPVRRLGRGRGTRAWTFCGSLWRSRAWALLVAVCAALYLSRRRPWFLSWALSWLCFSLYLLLACAASPGRACPSGALAPGCASVCGWLAAFLWASGTFAFHTGRPSGPRGRWLAPAVALLALALNWYVSWWWARSSLLAITLMVVSRAAPGPFSPPTAARRAPGQFRRPAAGPGTGPPSSRVTMPSPNLCSVSTAAFPSTWSISLPRPAAPGASRRWPGPPAVR